MRGNMPRHALLNKNICHFLGPWPRAISGKNIQSTETYTNDAMLHSGKRARSRSRVLDFSRFHGQGLNKASSPDDQSCECTSAKGTGQCFSASVPSGDLNFHGYGVFFHPFLRSGNWGDSTFITVANTSCICMGCPWVWKCHTFRSIILRFDSTKSQQWDG